MVAHFFAISMSTAWFRIATKYPNPSQLIFDEINKEKAKMEKTKIEQGLLTEADERIEGFLTEFLKNSGYKTVAIEFK